MDFTAFDDASLMRLVARENSDALGALYDRYGRYVFSVALNVIGSPESAEEIVQDVFTRVWEKAGTYDSAQAKVLTWLVSITRHRAIDELRRNHVRPEQNNVDWAEAIEIGDSHEPGPEAATEALMQQKSVRDAIGKLPADQRRVLALAYFKGYSQSEIAEITGEPLGTVKTRIRLAMQKLRQLLSTQVVDHY